MYYVLRVRNAMTVTVCAIAADEVRRGEQSATYWLEGALVYQVPLTSLQAQQVVEDRKSAEDLMKLWTVPARKGRLGPEFEAIRPGAGGKRQIGTAVEQVVAIVEDPRSRPRGGY